MAIVLNERCFNGALRISSTLSSNIKMHESWQTSLLTEQEIPAFFFFWFPTNVNSPVQDDIPREVKFVNVLYYRKCCTDIPSHFLLCWLICNKIDDKIEVSWGGHISNIKLREKMEAKMLCSSGEEQKNMSLLVHYQIRLKIT